MKNLHRVLPLLVFALLLRAFVPVDAQSNLPIDTIQLPPGFKIEVYASGIPNARSLALGANGTLFVG